MAFSICSLASSKIICISSFIFKGVLINNCKSRKIGFIFATLNNITMNFPENLKYTKDHEWIRIDGADAYVGITDFAQGELGDIVFVEINTVGQDFEHGGLFGTI